MNNTLKTVVVISVVAALAACAQKPGSKAAATPPPQAQGDGLDKLAKLSSADLLKEKYSSLAATCEVKAVDTPIPPAPVAPPKSPAPVAAEIENPNPTPTPPAAPPVVQPVVTGLKFVYDVKAQAAADATLSKVMPATLTSVDGKTVISLQIKPVLFSLTSLADRVKSIVRLRKHYPTLDILASVNGSPNLAHVQIVESIPGDTVIATSSTATLKTDLVMGCKLEGVIAKPEYQNQNLDINCDIPALDGQKAEYAANCGPAKPLPDVAPAQ